MNNDNKYLIGCNYWASNLGIYMWRGYDKEVIEKDMKVLSEHGVNCLRIFPLWPDFQPLSRNRLVNDNAIPRYSYNMRVGDRPLALCKFPDSGLDPKQVDNMNHFLTVAEEYGMKVIVSIITGWMSGRKLVPDPFIDRNLITDAEVVFYECNFIKDLIGEIKHHKNIIGWEPGNETNCLDYNHNEYQSEMWCKAIADTMRLADPTRPVYSGMHGTSTRGCFNLISQSRHFDVVTPHPYPCFTPYCLNEKLTEMRASLHAACEGSYYRSIAGKEFMIQEIGNMGPMFLNNDLVPNYFEKALLTSYQTGSTGFLWWCAFEQSHLDFAPYDLNAAETQLGLSYADHTPKPVLKKLAELRKDIDAMGEMGEPESDAVVILTNYYENSPWSIVYGSYMLAAQAGAHVDYVWEEQASKKADYYILPHKIDYNGLPKYPAKELYQRVREGAKLLVTADAGAIYDFEEVTGLRTLGNEKVAHTKKFTLNGKQLEINCNKTLTLEATTAKVLVKDTEGRIVLTENKLGKGSVMYLNAPIEKHYVEMNYPENTALYEVYKLFFKDKKKVVNMDFARVYSTKHNLADGKVGITLYNYNEENVLPIEIDKDYKLEKAFFADVKDGKITFEKNYSYLILAKK